MAEPKVRRRAARFFLGTMVDIAATGPAAAVSRGIEDAFAAIAEVHRALSAQDAGSELTRVNGLAHRGAQPISEAFRAVPAAPSTWRSARAARSIRRSGA